MKYELYTRLNEQISKYLSHEILFMSFYKSCDIKKSTRLSLSGAQANLEYMLANSVPNPGKCLSNYCLNTH